MMISLVSLDPAKNRFRFYQMELEHTLFGYCLTITWGRLDAWRRKRMVWLPRKDEAKKEIHRLLLRRKNHQYHIKTLDPSFQKWISFQNETFNSAITTD